MKKILTIAASVAFVACLMSSCATINSGAALGDKAPIGQKVGEATSHYYLFGVWSSNGNNNTIKEAAKHGGITNVSQVEYIDKTIFGGLIIKHTTRVYGE